MNPRNLLKTLVGVATIVAIGSAPVAGAQSVDEGSARPGSSAPGSSGNPMELLSGSAEAAPDAAPEGGARLVVFGDSMTSGTNAPFSVDSRNCPQGVTSWPAQVARQMGVFGTADFVNQACYGGALDTEPAFTLANQARAADNVGAFGPRTERVLIQLGFNDEWGNRNVRAIDAARMCWTNLRDGCGLDAVAERRAQDPAAVTVQSYRQRVEQVVEYIKYYAPNATIALVGYPDLRPPQADAICVSVLGLPLNNPNGAAFARFNEALQAAQRGAAHELGIEFVDLQAATAGHGPCTAAPWINGVIDFRTNPIGGLMHLSPAGEVVAARTVAATLGG